jgi:7-cyano-7-deazaguanine reductase
MGAGPTSGRPSKGEGPLPPDGGSYNGIEKAGIEHHTSRVSRTNKPNGLTLLGRSETRIPKSPSEARLETFPNSARRDYSVHFETDDFTSLCPITGQADFARIEIDYVPAKLCIETKSLKFYLASYRNERAFNEEVTNHILDDFVRAVKPKEARIAAQFSARGGIALRVDASFDGRP